MTIDSLASLKQTVLASGFADIPAPSSIVAPALSQRSKKWYRALSQRAAVCMIFADHPELGLAMLMIQRAVHASDPWSGHMAFPGGKHDTDDAHITATGLRELDEELSVQDAEIQRFGRLSDILARPYRPLKKPMVVTPLLFESATIDLDPAPNYEVADVLWIPLSHFVAQNRQTMVWQKNGLKMELPCYYYQEKKIWGLSLMMIDELIQDCHL